MRKILVFEVKRILTRQSFIAFLLIAFLLLGICQIGTIKYLKVQKEAELFGQAENEKLSRYQNINQYGALGFKIFIMPSPFFSYCFHQSPLSDTETLIDSGPLLKNQKTLNINALFDFSYGLDYSLLVLYIILISGFVIGFFSLRNKEYILFLLQFGKSKFKAFLAIILSRVMLLSLGFLLIQCASILLIKFNKVEIAGDFFKASIIFMIMNILIIGFIVPLGVAVGQLKKMNSVWLLIAIFLIFIVMPGIFSLLSSGYDYQSYNLVELKRELKKLTILTDFQNKIVNETKGMNQEEQREYQIKQIPRFLTEVTEKMEIIDRAILQDIQKYKKNYYFISTLNPISFFHTTVQELSGLGIESFIKICQENVLKKRKFMIFYLNQKLIKRTIEPFLKDGQNIYKTTSEAPELFVIGFFVSLIYIVILLIGGYNFMKRNYLESSDSVDFNPAGFSGIKTMPKAIITVYSQESYAASWAIILGFFNMGPLAVKNKETYFYFPAQSSFPRDIYLKRLIDLLDGAYNIYGKKKLSDLSELEFYELLASNLPKDINVYLLFGITLQEAEAGGSNFEKHLVDFLKAGNCIIALQKERQPNFVSRVYYKFGREYSHGNMKFFSDGETHFGTGVDSSDIDDQDTWDLFLEKDSLFVSEKY